MSWTQSEIDVLKAALKSGVRVVKFADRVVEYQDLDAMRKLLADMQADVTAQAGGKPYSLASTRKGLD